MTHTDHTHTDDVARELAVLQDQVNGLADPNAAAEAVAAELDYLYSVGADTQSLQVIHDQASVLLDASQQLGQAFSAALHVAQRIREQRNTAQEALAKLKTAVENADLDQPEVAQLFEELSEMAQEDAEVYFWDMMWEFLEDHIVMNTPLE
ncbi:MAG: hypothetical protein GX573_20885 [Chloroflexi bacterium]|nr:hypothetical protein [Chloroflexota bacterium]